MSAEDRLASLLEHYFSHVWEAAGLGWDGDHSAEIRSVAELVVEVARKEATKIVEGRAS